MKTVVEQKFKTTEIEEFLKYVDTINLNKKTCDGCNESIVIILQTEEGSTFRCLGTFNQGSIIHLIKEVSRIVNYLFNGLFEKQEKMIKESLTTKSGETE